MPAVPRKDERKRELKPELEMQCLCRCKISISYTISSTTAVFSYCRKQFFYPPFYRIIHLTIKHKDKNIAEEAANILGRFLSTTYGMYLSGPSEPPVNRVRNQFIFELLLKLPKDTVFIRRCKDYILQQIAILQSNKRYRSVTIVPDVDAV